MNQSDGVPQWLCLCFLFEEREESTTLVLPRVHGALRRAAQFRGHDPLFLYTYT